MRICPFDIENMYTNIPKVEVLNIIENIMESDPEIKEAEQEEIINGGTKLLPIQSTILQTNRRMLPLPLY
jgi:hypothetical protein